MKLQKALKEKKRLAAEIAELKTTINSKNSYTDESVKDKFNINTLYKELIGKVESLINLKLMINEANKEIQGSIYKLSEYKSLISFLSGLNVYEGTKREGFTDNFVIYYTQIDEIERNEMKKELQKKADLIQDEIDTYNYTTDIPWNNDELE